MLTVEDYAEIRRAHRDGMSIRAIAKQYHRSRRKIREALKAPEPEPYTRTKTPAAPKLGAFIPVIDEILDADQSAPPKQRHTAAQLFRRIVKEGYSGGYDQVRRYVAKHRIRERETFLPLDHAPGQRAEADFGHIYVDFPEGRRMVNVLLLTWAHSYRPFAIALPTERVEAILHGMVEAFEFFGTVPRELWWDNPTTVATAILTGRQRTLHPRYQALASHYNFNPLFCMPARGNEKPYVENRVKNLQRRWATPVPQVRDIAELNTYLRECCEQDLERVATGQSQSEARCEFALGQTDSPATDCVEIQLDSGTPPRVHVPQPNLKCFDQFLVTGGHYDGEVQRSNPTFEDEPQAPSLADHAGGIREVGAGGVSGQRRLPAVPAAINGIGTGHPRDQRLESEDQASGLPGREGL